MKRFLFSLDYKIVQSNVEQMAHVMPLLERFRLNVNVVINKILYIEKHLASSFIHDLISLNPSHTFFRIFAGKLNSFNTRKFAKHALFKIPYKSLTFNRIPLKNPRLHQRKHKVAIYI